MDIWCIFAIILACLGIIGSIVPGLPGPPLSWIGLLLVYISGKSGGAEPMSLSFLLIWLGVVAVATVLDYIVPAWATKLSGGHKQASVGATVGLFVGMLIPPIGILIGALLGAFIGELIFADKGIWDSFKASLGAFVGFILGTGLKLICSGVLFYEVVKYAV